MCSGEWGLTAAVVLQITQNDPRLLGWQIGANPHVQQDCLPLRCGALGRVTFRMAPIAVHRVKFGAGQSAGLLPLGGRGFGVGSFVFRAVHRRATRQAYRGQNRGEARPHRYRGMGSIGYFHRRRISERCVSTARFVKRQQTRYAGLTDRAGFRLTTYTTHRSWTTTKKHGVGPCHLYPNILDSCPPTTDK